MAPRLSPPVASAVAATVADLVGAGTSGVVLLGSQVRGDAHEYSDVDLVALGEGPNFVLKQMDDVLMSVAWRPPAAVRAAFADPKEAGGAVPGWRSAVILHDRDGDADRLVQQSNAWSWDDIEERRRDWIAAQVTGRAEVVHRLVGSLASGRSTAAAVSRNKLATRLPVIAAVHHKMLYESGHRLLDTVSKAMGERWRHCQDAALGVHGEPLPESSAAALELYTLLAPAVEEYLNPDQKAVVTAAADLAWATKR